MRLLRTLPALIGTSIKGALALRGAFLSEATLMFLNDLCFFVIWIFFFQNATTIGGWRFEDVTLMYGIALAAYGLKCILAYGSNDLALTIVEGGLDPHLLRPSGALASVLCSKSSPGGWGDLVGGAAFVLASGHLDWRTAPSVLAGIVAGAVLFLSFKIVLHSLAFWMGDIYEVAKAAGLYIITVSVYPGSIFSGLMKFSLFTIAPTAFITYLPVEAVRREAPSLAALSVVMAAVWFRLAVVVFSSGLTRYQSGSRVG